MADAEETTAAEPEKKTKETKSYSVTLVDGKKNELVFSANKKKQGWSAYITKRNMDKAGKFASSERGASEEFDSLDEAKEHLSTGIALAEKQGWSKRESAGGGYKARPDAFTLTSLPKPAK